MTVILKEEDPMADSSKHSEAAQPSHNQADNWIVVAWEHRQVEKHRTSQEAVTLFNTSTGKFKVWNGITAKYDDSGNDLASNNPDSTYPPGRNPINTEVSDE